jgi:hypothetical protein
MEPTRLDQIFSQAQAAFANRGSKAVGAINGMFAGLIRQNLQSGETEVPEIHPAEPLRHPAPVSVRQNEAHENPELPAQARPEQGEKTYSGTPDIRAADHAAPSARVHEMDAVCHGNSAVKCTDEPDDMGEVEEQTEEQTEEQVEDTTEIDENAGEPEPADTSEAADADPTEAEADTAEEPDAPVTFTDTGTPPQIAGLIEGSQQAQVPPSDANTDTAVKPAPILVDGLELPPVETGTGEALTDQETKTGVPGDFSTLVGTDAESDPVAGEKLAQQVVSLLASDASEEQVVSLLASGASEETAATETLETAERSKSTPTNPSAGDTGVKVSVVATGPANDNTDAKSDEMPSAPALANLGEENGKSHNQSSGQAGKENAGRLIADAKSANAQAQTNSQTNSQANSQANSGNQNNPGLGQGQGQGKPLNPAGGQV